MEGVIVKHLPYRLQVHLFVKSQILMCMYVVITLTVLQIHSVLVSHAHTHTHSPHPSHTIATDGSTEGRLPDSARQLSGIVIFF